MAERNQKKVDTGKALLDSYQRDKLCKVHQEKVGDGYFAGSERFVEAQSSSSDISRIKMDVATLHKKTAQFECFTKQQEKLQNELSEKNKIIESLQLENKVLLHGHGDDPNTVNENNKIIKELQTMVQGRETYIKQLSESLQSKANELEVLKVNEKELRNEILDLKHKNVCLAKQCEDKVKESYSETIGYKAKVELLTNQVKEYSETIASLRDTLKLNNQKLISQQQELAAKDKKLNDLKHTASNQVKELMSQMEALNHDLSKKEEEVVRCKREVEGIQASIEEKFGLRLQALKKELEKKYKDDVKKVEEIYDSMGLDQIRKSKDYLQAADTCNKLQAEVSTCKLNYDKDVKQYQDELMKLQEKSKVTEQQLLQDLEVQRGEVDHYRQQVENVENKLSEAVQKVKDDCYLELNKYVADMNARIMCDQEKLQKYEADLEKLSIQLKHNALREAETEVEIETYRSELQKSALNINNILENLNDVKVKYDKLRNKCYNLESEHEIYKDSNSKLALKLQESQKNEEVLSMQLQLTLEKVKEYEEQIVELNEKYSMKVNSVEQQVQRLMTELERNKTMYEDKILHLNSQIGERQKVIKELESKITYLVRMTSYDTCKEELGHSQEGLAQESVSNMQLIGKDYLIDVFTKLKEVKNSMEALLYSKPKQFPESKEQIDNLDSGELIEKLDKTLWEVLNLTQSLQVDEEGYISLNTSYENHALSNPPQIITSTPYPRGFSNSTFPIVIDTSVDSPSSNEIIRGWMERCRNLENENKQLACHLTSITKHSKEMEICLMDATKETRSFDERCKSFSMKLDELEKSKLNEHILKKENDSLKQQLQCLKESEQELCSKLAAIQDKSKRLEEEFNKNLSEIANQFGPNTDVQMLFAQLNEKSDEILYLKSQLVTLQKSEKEQKQKALDAHSKYASLVVNYELLENELKKKCKELEDICQVKKSLETEKQLLQSGLNSTGGNQPCVEVRNQNGFDDKSSVKKHNCGIGPSTGKDQNIASTSDDLKRSRLETMELVSSSDNLASCEDIPFSRSTELQKTIEHEVKLLDKMLEDGVNHICLATIPEEDSDDSLCLKQEFHSDKQVHS